MWLLDFHPHVEADLTEAAEWYERQQPRLGDRFLDEAAHAFSRLPHDALLHAIRLADIRRVNLPSFPHGVFYFAMGDAVVVLAVLHGARHSETALLERRKKFP